jgi:hypothetical protein
VESLRRSRAKWLSEGIFEKYYTKPTAKNKGSAELANNPPKDSMTKLGTCTITVEPHIFDAQMWAIKDPTPRAAASLPPQQQPMYRPIIQYGPPNGVMPPPRLPPSQASPPQQIHQAPPRPQDTPMVNANPPHGTHQSPYAPAPNQPAHTTPNPPPPNPPPADSAKRTDPVIQMLAEQAATDPDLKALMKTVANGEASPDQLKQFQSHIDHLTRLHKQRQAAAERKAEATPQQHNGHANPTYANPPPNDSVHQGGGSGAQQHAAQPHTIANGHVHPSPSPTTNHGPMHPTGLAPSQGPLAGPTPHGHAPGQQYQPHPQPQALRSKGPLPSTKPDITGVVFEFTGGSGDRFLFPKFSILEYLPQGQVIASFLIVRKGSASDSPAYDPELDYYQPITIRLYAHQGRQLDALQKVVAPPDEVRRYMDDIMDNMTRAEYVLLAMRLPRDEPTSTAKETREQKEPKDGEPNKPIRMDDQVLWATTNPTPAPVPVQAAPRLLTEEEKYQSFISTVTQKV